MKNYTGYSCNKYGGKHQQLKIYSIYDRFQIFLNILLILL